MGNINWTDPTLVPKSTKVKVVHINELRDATESALTELEQHKLDPQAHAEATTENPGFMSALDKKRVNGYIYEQLQPNSVWAIYHNLNKYPSVAVVDSAGSVVFGEITYTSLNSLTVTFSAPFAGSAYIS